MTGALILLTFAFLLTLMLGIVVGYLIAERRSRAAQTDQAVAREQARQAAAALAEHQHALSEHRGELAALQQERASLDAQLVAEKNSVAQQRQFHIDAARKADEELARNQQLQYDMADLQNQHGVALARLDAERHSLAAEREHFADAKARIREAFNELSGEALQKNSLQFFELAAQTFKTLQTEAAGGLEEKKSQIAAIIQPMSSLLDQYKQSVDKIEVARGEAYTNIQKELAAVAATHKHLSSETSQLVSALRKPQGRGQWGEMTLRRLFELAGLAARVSFDEQVSLTTEDGRLRPDCIVRMPRGRQVIVDSKCVLDAFLDASCCEDDAQRLGHMARHAKQVRSRIDELASKDYFSAFKGSAEFTVLFLPGEAFLYAAVEHDPKLIEDALRQHILIAAPSTLMGMLRVIDHAWRQQEIEDNAKDIRKQADELYKRLATLSEHFDKLGAALGSATDAYNGTLRSLERNVFTQARRMAKLGVSAARPVRVLEEIDLVTHDLKASSWGGLPITSTDALNGTSDEPDEPENAAGSEMRDQLEESLPQLSPAESAALDSEPLRSAQTS